MEVHTRVANSCKKGGGKESQKGELQKRVAKRSRKRTITTTTTTMKHEMQKDCILRLLGKACFGNRFNGIDIFGYFKGRKSFGPAP